MNMTYQCLLAIVAGIVTATGAAAETANQLSDAERRAGWQLLFDGRTTAGWRNYGQESLSNGWQVRNGALTRVANEAGDIVTTSTYDKFELSLEYRIAPGGNSGVMFHVVESQSGAADTGPEVQIFDNAAGDHEQQSGWLYDLYQPLLPFWAEAYDEVIGTESETEIDATRPAGQWNHIYLRVSDTGEVAINGIHYFFFELGSHEWQSRVAASKFADLPAFAKAGSGHICLQDHGDEVAFRNIKLRPLGDGGPRNPIDAELSLRVAPAFPDISWAGWEPFGDDGRVRPLRPLTLTPAGDGSGRLFAAMQDGTIHVFPNRRDTAHSKLYLDLSDRVTDFRRGFVWNEEGLLGLAFHPRYDENGELFVYYTSQTEPHTSIVSRFRVSADDPNRAAPDSEQVLMKLPQPFPNHNGGALLFGPDGYLYIGLGDGGYRNDRLNLAQDLGEWMGSLLRIDVDREEEGKAYAVPPDNPFRDQPGAQPEIYAYGFRNLWRPAFDRQTGLLWTADVGQDLWEEINIVQKGGNYGWSVREGSYAFGNRTSQNDDSPLDPIWEYDHQIGKSITGGFVYRGERFPQLTGHYLYADFVSGRQWALHYDPVQRRVIRNVGIAAKRLPIFAYGEDAAGEIYLLVESVTGDCIYRYEPSD